MKVLLVSADTEQTGMPVLPLGLACVAAAAQRAGHDVNLKTLMAEQDSLTALKEIIEAFEPEAIGISVRNIDDQTMENPKFLLDSIKEIVTRCQGLSHAPIILGGAGYSIYPQSALDYLKADMGIQGEGEIAFITLLERLHRKADLSGIPGLYLPEGGLQGKVRLLRSLDDCLLPLPEDPPWIPSTLKDQRTWIPVQTRRGCSMDCNYCSTAIIEGRMTRRRSPERVVELMRRYVEAGFKRFAFVDNIFNLPTSYAKALCDQIIAAGISVSWTCIVYPWKMDEELVEKMARAGCRGISLGSESGSSKILKIMNKKFQPEDVRQISGWFKKYSIQQMGFLLLGGPGENKKTVKESLEFTDSLDLESVKITIGIRIYPYTALARIAVRDNIIEPNDDLLFPRFYMTGGLEEWLRKTVSDWTAERPHWG
ncbi:MAG: radical SAM protein [Deltaproteobacteria bacterium]|nr:radical SAM protein [Deltaproteobacteria bacterium]MBW2085633.1 radical SAM protein [Deltaproteobacteria bacterium]